MILEYKNEINYLKKKRIKFSKEIYNSIREKKAKFISKEDNELSNYGWLLESVFYVKKTYIESYNCLRQKDYEKAWNLLDEIDITIDIIIDNFSEKELKKFGLLFIKNQIYEIQKLFPYVFFVSREAIIKEERCSICGKVRSLRNCCEHIPNKLYMGTLCQSIVTDMELKGFALVKKPADKFCVFKPIGFKFNYMAVDYFIKNSLGPYDAFHINESIKKLPKYANAKITDDCPCKSGLKYKDCCMGTTKETIKHLELIFDHQLNDNGGEIIQFCTIVK